jgi:OOP family OmpA-OmpF porin
MVADRDVRFTTERQGDPMTSSQAADTSDRKVLRGSWAEPPFPPPPEPPLPPPPEPPVPPSPFPPSPPTSSGEG